MDVITNMHVKGDNSLSKNKFVPAYEAAPRKKVTIYFFI